MGQCFAGCVVWRLWWPRNGRVVRAVFQQGHLELAIATAGLSGGVIGLVIGIVGTAVALRAFERARTICRNNAVD